MSILGATTWAGTLPSWALLVVALLAAWRITKGGGGSAVSELSKANDVLTRRLHQLGSEVRDLRVENERLQARTDFAQALAPVMEGLLDSTMKSEERQVGILAGMASHEERAQARQASLLHVLDLMAERLGEEHHGH